MEDLARPSRIDVPLYSSVLILFSSEAPPLSGGLYEAQVQTWGPECRASESCTGTVIRSPWELVIGRGGQYELVTLGRLLP